MDQYSMAWLIDGAVEWELYARNLYIGFSDLFSHVPKVATAWRELADDEAQHVEFLQEIRSTLPHERLESQVGVAQFNAFLAVARLLKEILGAKIRTLNDAFELAYKIEQSEINALFLYLADKSDPSQARKEFLLAQIKQHEERLAALGREFKYQQRKQIRVANQSESQPAAQARAKRR